MRSLIVLLSIIALSQVSARLVIRAPNVTVPTAAPIPLPTLFPIPLPTTAPKPSSNYQQYLTLNSSVTNNVNGDLGIVDCAVLNDERYMSFYLSLTRVTVAMYTQFLDVFDSLKIDSAISSNATVFRQQLTTIYNEEQYYVGLLNFTINDLCSSVLDFLAQDECYVIPPCNYTFRNETRLQSTAAAATCLNCTHPNATGIDQFGLGFSDYMNYAMLLADNTAKAGVSILPMFSNPALANTIARVNAVQQRHAAFIRLSLGVSPFPDNVEPVISTRAAKCRVLPFIADVKCCLGFEHISC